MLNSAETSPAVGQTEETQVVPRPTVVCIAIRKGKQVLLAQSAKDPTGRTWGCPQGGVNSGERSRAAIAREMNEEVGLQLDDLTLRKAKKLHEFLNVLPPGRAESTKFLKFYPLQIHGSPQLVLNQKEVTAVKWVGDWSELWSTMGTVARKRPEKCLATWHALDLAIQDKLLAWPRMPAYMPESLSFAKVV